MFFQDIIFIFWYLYYILVACKTRTNDKIDENVIKDINFQSIWMIWKKTWLFEPKKGINRGLVSWIIIFIPIFIIILSLLSNSSLVFNHYLSNILKNIWTDIFVLIISAPIAFLLFKIIYHNTIWTKNEIEKSNIKPQNTLFKIILIVLSITYLFFILSAYLDITWFIPENESANTISEFARKWFFELAIVAAINFWVFIATKIFTKNDKSTKILLTIIWIFTICIIWIALYKMFTYIWVFGQTLLRFNTSFFMICLLITVIFAIISIWTKFNYIWNSISVIARLFLALCFINEEWIITSYNINHALYDQINRDKTIIASEIQWAKYLYIWQEDDIRDLAEQYLSFKTLTEEQRTSDYKIENRYYELTWEELERLQDNAKREYEIYVNNENEKKEKNCQKIFNRRKINYTIDYITYHKRTKQYCEK